MIVDDGRVRGGLAALAEALTASGHLSSPRWRDPLLTVRRHVFVPPFWQDEDPGAFPARWRMIDNATADHDEWLAAVYSDRSLPTELLGVPASDGRGMHPLVTSSTTMPSLVIAMLEALDIDDSVDGVSVLEIGTATGYNAALLCQRLGDHRVTTIEISPELAALAQVRLAAHGYHPHVEAGDGAEGVPARAPFDRIIATCGLDHIPPPRPSHRWRPSWPPVTEGHGHRFATTRTPTGRTPSSTSGPGGCGTRSKLSTRRGTPRAGPAERSGP